ncbi:MAG TPA: AMP-binding protein [Acidimicrobiia bacterium]|nr:AMP-binding protein [Acidimicrobiia bacterium]
MDAAIDPLAAHAAATPDAIAVVVDDTGDARARVVTFAELDRMVNRLAHALRALGVARGDRVVWCGPNSCEVLAILHAARKLGVIAVPLSYRFSADEMAYVIENSEATAVLVDGEYAATVASVADRLHRVRAFVTYDARVPGLDAAPPEGFDHWDALLAEQPDDEPPPLGAEVGGAMIYTSGTTGKPKGALRTTTDRALVFAMLAKLDLLHPDPVHLTTGPLYHSGPLAFASLAHTVGAPVIVLRRFDASAWIRVVREHRVTNTFSAPTQLKRIVGLPVAELADADLSSMRCLIANAAPVPYALKEEVIAKLGDGFLYEVYGSTELGVTTILEPADQLRKPGSCGLPYGGVRIRIIRDDGSEADPGEPGELFIDTTLAMDGYHRSDEQLSQLTDGTWKSVGDIAYVDDEGYVHICDRKKDMIISAGVNIYPAEIEAVLHSHPLVLDCAVFGIPDDEWGEAVHAIVQPKPGAALDLDEVRAFVEPQLGRYKRPRTYEMREELPRTDAGKLLKRVLRDEFWSGRGSLI